MAAISAAAISAGLSDEATRLEEFEMSEVEGTPVRRLSSAEGQLRDESDSLALPAASPSPALSSGQRQCPAGWPHCLPVLALCAVH
jgi:hypothetical protein